MGGLRILLVMEKDNCRQHSYTTGRTEIKKPSPRMHETQTYHIKWLWPFEDQKVRTSCVRFRPGAPGSYQWRNFPLRLALSLLHHRWFSDDNP